MTVLTSSLFVSVCLAVVVSAATESPRQLPDFGVIPNDDADFTAMGGTPEDSAKMLRDNVDTLAGTRVKTLIWSAAAGSARSRRTSNACAAWSSATRIGSSSARP